MFFEFETACLFTCLLACLLHACSLARLLACLLACFCLPLLASARFCWLVHDFACSYLLLLVLDYFCLLGCLVACLLARSLACLLACFVCLLACLLAGWLAGLLVCFQKSVFLMPSNVFGVEIKVVFDAITVQQLPNI